MTMCGNSEFTTKQMRELRRGLRKGLDMTEYADPPIPAEEMNEIRLQLEDDEMKDKITAVSLYRDVW